MPGGRGISFYPSGRWTRSSGPTHTSSSRSTSRPVRPEFLFEIFRFWVRKPGCFCFGAFLRPSGCFSVRGSGAVFPVFFGWGWLFPFFCLLCCLAFLHLLSRERASAGKPAAMAPDPPPVANYPVPSYPSPAGSRPRYGLVHDGWGGVGAIVTPSTPRLSTIAVTIVLPGARSPPP